MHLKCKLLCGLALLILTLSPVRGAMVLTDVPDYSWHAGCFGTACGNLMGYWDRHGLPDLYTGPTAGGVAPLDNYGSHIGIESMWASQAGLDGRPGNQPGHIDDYWNYYISDAGNNFSYESTQSDPYVLAGRAEHTPDCIGDFVGLSMKKWVNMNGECDGNIDAYCFNYWAKTGARRTNYTPPPQGSVPVKDLQSGLRAWARYRGYESEVFTQLAAGINPETPAGAGFTFADLKAEINAGYPVLIFLQGPGDYSRALPNMARANPELHGVLAYGYDEWDDGTGNLIPKVHIKFSWAIGEVIETWSSDTWLGGYTLCVRGVIGFHPRPKIKTVSVKNGNLTLNWEGPSSQLLDSNSGITTTVHRYQVEWAPKLNPAQFSPVGPVVTAFSAVLPAAGGGTGFYRVSLLPR